MKPLSTNRGYAFGIFFAATWASLIVMALAAGMRVSVELYGGFGVISASTAILIASQWPEDGPHE